MAGSKVHSSAAQYQIPRSRLAERASRAGLRENIALPSEKRPPAMSQETSLRVPQAVTDGVKEQGEPRVRDFQDTISTKSNAAPTRDVSPMDNNMPMAPGFEVASSPEDESAPPPPDFTRRGMHVSSRTRYDCSSLQTKGRLIEGAAAVTE